MANRLFQKNLSARHFLSGLRPMRHRNRKTADVGMDISFGRVVFRVYTGLMVDRDNMESSGSGGGRTLREIIRRKHEIVFFSHCNCATICKIKNEQKDPESIFYRSKNITIHIYEVT